MGDIPAVCFVGRSQAGKTTLIEKLIPELKRRGYRVGTVKRHAHAGFEIDRPGKDTWRHAQAGSDHVVIAAPDKMASIRRLQHEITLAEILATMDDVDVVLVEGFKQTGVNRIEIVRSAHNTEPLSADGEVLAVVSDIEVELAVPHFGLDDVTGLAGFIEDRLLRLSKRGTG